MVTRRIIFWEIIDKVRCMNINYGNCLWKAMNDLLLWWWYRYSAPEELFGPLSLKALENDQYIRNIDGYLPSCNVAFLDEIFKANSAILNSLLTILNERTFSNGNQNFKIPLLIVVGASNELPDDDNLDALYDRFLFRKIIQPISDDNLSNLLTIGRSSDTYDNDNDNDNNDDNNQSSKLSFQKSILLTNEFLKNIQQKSQFITVSNEIIIFLRNLRKYLRDEIESSIYISDRRLVKAMKTLRISAFTNGRSYVSMMDCLLLRYMLWDNFDDIEIVDDYIWANIIPEG